jgi:para-aminobenzoate synthetase component 1
VRDYAYFAGRLATGLAEVSHDPAVLDGPGWWAVVGSFEGRWTCARFTDVRPAPLPEGAWTGTSPTAWRTSLGRRAYEQGVREVREQIASGWIYQVNLCRVLTAPVSGRCVPAGLARLLAAGNPAPYAGVVDLPDAGVQVVTASPELFLSRSGDLLASGPIKGTGRTAADLLPKDTAENIMIVDLVRNDLAHVARPGTVDVPELCVVREHPGLVHLESRVTARLSPGRGWPEILDAAFPPGSVTGAPKYSALKTIEELEREPRGPYCGAVGWVDGDRQEAELAVGIRTFWMENGLLRFGTGAGITWGSDPAREWAETELKASRLIGLANTRG